ncbi:MAG TPA: hypothetical protein VER96_30320 [Polyangiaceae bacterium]|nr:hypothetical protein [Polyangiaceae bacterium]
MAIACSGAENGGDPSGQGGAGGAASAGGATANGGVEVSGAQNGSAGENAGMGGSDSSDGAAGQGHEQGGAAGNDTPSAAAGAAGDGLGGNAGAATAGDTAGAGGEDDGSNANTEPHWLSFNQQQGSFVYDVSRFPDSSALFKLTSKTNGTDSPLGPWSPDGRSLLYFDYQDIYCRDMTQATPGPARLIAATPTVPDFTASTVTRLSWSGDSASAALVTGTSLVVFDPRQDNPTFQTVTTSIQAATWAPMGNHLLYRDATGFHVVAVDAGQPSVSQPLDITVFRSWSSDGKSLAVSNGPTLYLVDVTGASLVTTAVTSPAGMPQVSAVRFSPDGKSLAFIAVLSRPKPDLFYARLDNLAAPQAITAGLPASARVANFTFWSPDGRWLGFTISDGLNTVWQAANVSGDTPGAPFSIKPQATTNYSWLTKRPNTFVAYSTSFVTYDLSTPEIEPVPVLKAALSLSALSPRGDWLAADDVDAVAMRNLNTLTEAADIRVHLSSSTNQLLWSPDGQFLSIIASQQGYVQGLIRVDGSAPSAPVFLSPASGGNILAYWQPVFR